MKRKRFGLRVGDIELRSTDDDMVVMQVRAIGQYYDVFLTPDQLDELCLLTDVLMRAGIHDA